MPDTAALNIININIDSIEAASMQKEIATQTQVMPKHQTSGRKLMWQRRAVQTWMKV